MKIYKKYLVIMIIFLFFGANLTTAQNYRDSQKKSIVLSEIINGQISTDEVFPPPSWSIEQTNPSSTWVKSVVGTTKYAICTETGSIGIHNENITTCSLNCTGLTGVYVKFDKFFYSNTTYESIGSVSFSIDNGSSWIILKFWNTTDILSTEIFNLTLADGKDQLKVRWSFESTDDDDKSDYFWFDNVYIGNDTTTLYETTFDENINDIIIGLSSGIYPQADFVLKFENNCSQSRYYINYLISWSTLSSIPPKYPSGSAEGVINISASPANLTVQSGQMNISGFMVIAKIVITATVDCSAPVSKNALLIKFGPIKLIVISLINN